MKSHNTNELDLAIQIEGLNKSYDGVQALDNVNFSVQRGQFCGLLGPNGAGKSTTINILTGLVRKDSGSTSVFGYDTVRDFRKTRSCIGVAPQEIPVDWFFPIEKLLLFQAGYYGIPNKQAIERVHYLFDKLGLYEKRQSKFRALSGGMKRRFQLAKALVHDPEILILDEPTAGVDVTLRHTLWDYLRELHLNGKTILLTTHYIEEAELLCERVSIIHKGSIISEGAPSELTQQIHQAGITIQLSDWDDNLSELLSGFTYTIDKNRFHFMVKEAEAELPKLITLLSKNGYCIQRAKLTEPTLEDVFLHLTGTGINE